MISAMLQSPYFLYRSELGTQSGNTFTLTPYEVGSELAYTLTGTAPDSTLLSAVDSVVAGSLSLWESDGTPSGTRPLVELTDRLYGLPIPRELLVVGNRAFFTTSSPGLGTELWALRPE